MEVPHGQVCSWPCLGKPSYPNPAPQIQNDTLNQAAPKQKQKLSYAEIAKDRLERTVDLAQLPVPTMKGDTPVIKISATSVDKGLQHLRYSLVTRIEAQGRSMVDIKAGIADLWSEMGAIVSPLGKGYLLARFNAEIDYKKVKFGGSWRYGKQMLRLSDWSPNFNVDKQKHSNALIWVKFPGLSLEYWELEILMAMARTVGTPIHVDRNTLKRDNGFYASVMVEVDLSKPCPRRILVEVEDKEIEFWQEIALGALPDFCNNCKVVGHLAAGCRFLSPMAAEQGACKEKENVAKVAINGRQAIRRKRKRNKGDMKTNDIVINLETEKEGGEASHAKVAEVEVPKASHFPVAIAEKIPVINVEPEQELAPTLELVDIAEMMENVQGIESIPESSTQNHQPTEEAAVQNSLVEEEMVQPLNQENNLEVPQDQVSKPTQEGNSGFVFNSGLQLSPIGDVQEDPPDFEQAIGNTLGLDSPIDNLPTDDEVLVPESQLELVREAGIIAKLLEGGSTRNKQGGKIKERRLVAKFSKKNVVALPPGPLKERLEAMSEDSCANGEDTQ